jgi:hypothetical protein
MKTKIIACAVALALAGVTPAMASDRHPDPGAIVVDTVLVRPFCLAATILGSAFFVISLPLAAGTGGIHRSAESLVSKPWHATFTRPLGDFEDLSGEYF